MEIRGIFCVCSLALAALFPGLAQAQHQLVATHADISATLPNGGRLPHWTSKRLAGCDPCLRSPVLTTIGDHGEQEFVALDIPAADYADVRDVAAGPDGSLVAVGWAMSGDSRMGAFIAWVSPDRSHQVLTRVWPYNPYVVAIGSDTTIWTLGPVMTDHNVPRDPNVLRHYTPSGQILAATTIRDAKHSDGGLRMVSDASALMVSADRVGWLTMACEYFEFSFDGVELGRYGCPKGYSDIHELGGVGLSSADDLLVGAKEAAPLAPLALDRATNSWRPVPVLQDSGITGRILGFDGLTLMTSGVSGLRRYTLSGGPLAGGQ
jgi:hypothetical protein